MLKNQLIRAITAIAYEHAGQFLNEFEISFHGQSKSDQEWAGVGFAEALNKTCKKIDGMRHRKLFSRLEFEYITTLQQVTELPVNKPAIEHISVMIVEEDLLDLPGVMADAWEQKSYDKFSSVLSARLQGFFPSTEIFIAMENRDNLEDGISLGVLVITDMNGAHGSIETFVNRVVNEVMRDYKSWVVK